MSPEQRHYFCIEPIFGYPRLLARVLSVNLKYAKNCEMDNEVGNLADESVGTEHVRS